jgi:hypothetical protein
MLVLGSPDEKQKMEHRAHEEDTELTEKLCVLCAYFVPSVLKSHLVDRGPSHLIIKGESYVF